MPAAIQISARRQIEFPENSPGALVFARDRARRGRGRRADGTWTMEAIREAALRLSIPDKLLPKVPSDRSVLAKIMARVVSTGPCRGILIQQTNGSRALRQLDFFAVVDGKSEKVGAIEWRASDGLLTVPDHPIAQGLLEEYESKRGRIGLIEWGDHLRIVILEHCQGLMARQEGRVYWVPLVSVKPIAQLAALTEELDVFTVIYVPLMECMMDFVGSLVVDTLWTELEECRAEVLGYTGKEDLRRYRRMLRRLAAVAAKLQVYQHKTSTALHHLDTDSVYVEVKALKKTVTKDYLEVGEEAMKLDIGGFRREPRAFVARRRNLDLPKHVAPPPVPMQPALAELAPLPDPFVGIGNLIMKRRPDLDGKNMHTFAAEKGETDSTFEGLREHFGSWLSLDEGHALLSDSGGLPRIYLTKLTEAAAKSLHDLYGIALHL